MPNHLVDETSPYLLQHLDNPVDWHPWGDEALARAKKENKPILLSIGYAACHWCHVMAHESFEDKSIAALMNKHYINIKVDREERPDLDKIYQTTHSLLTQRSGGWPLTMFLTPDEHMPFFAGTYFPNEARDGMPGFSDILIRVSDAYESNKESIQQQNIAIRDVFKKINDQDNISTDELTAIPIDVAKNQLKKNFDPEYGGFGIAPKFPHPSNIELALKLWSHSLENKHEDFDLLNTATFTLEKMAEGGIFDQLGGGFCRYSVDNKWQIPHFEKMLYDNGPLLSIYAQTFALLNDESVKPYENKIIETAEWVMREMTSQQGAYYSSLDADSEGEEGTFYIWTVDEIKKALTEDEFLAAQKYYGLEGEINFEGKWHLNIQSSIDNEIAETIKQKLFNERSKRIHPGRDEKILTSWNALMIKGMALSGRLLQRGDFIQSAHNAIDFIRTTMFKENRLLATYKDGNAHLMAYLDDYVFLIDALLESLQAKWRSQDCDFAIQLSDIVMSHFYDDDNGGFYFTANDHEALIQRPKPLMDEAIPAGNGIAAYALNRLGHLIGEQRYINAAQDTLHYAWASISEIPYAHAALLFALDEKLNLPDITVIRGSDDEIQNWQKACDENYQLNKLVFAIPDSITKLPGLLNDKSATDETMAYICSGTSCMPPISNINELKLN